MDVPARTLFLLVAALGVVACGGAKGNPPSERGSADTQAKRETPVGAEPARVEETTPLASPAQPEGGFDVVVTGPGGWPLEGAHVSHPRSEATTDARGGARLAPTLWDMGSPSGDRYWKTVTVRAPGYVPVARVRPWGADGVARIQLDERGHRITGTVVDLSGRRLPDVQVRLQTGSHPEVRMTSDADGSFSSEDAPGTEGVLVVRDGAWRADPVRVLAPQAGVEILAWRLCLVYFVLDPAPGTSAPAPSRLGVTGRGWVTDLGSHEFVLGCDPGPVTLTCDGLALAGFDLEEGEVRRDVVVPCAVAE